MEHKPEKTVKLKLGTRKSALAMVQSNWDKTEIERHHPEVQVELFKITTKGDRMLDVPLAKVGGKGLFVKEIEDAMLGRHVDLAVHSLKDVPTEIPSGLEVSVFPRREDCRDALISREKIVFEDLPAGIRVGTSSLRRLAQLKASRPDLEVVPVRGNVDTRLRKLDEGQFEAMILATAGLRRLGLQEKITQILETDTMLPAIGQGALGIEFRSDDSEVREILSSIHHEHTAVCVRVERAFLAKLEGGCQVPIGAHARLEDNELSLDGLVGSEDGKTIIRMQERGPATDPEGLGISLGEKILAAGGSEILTEVYRK